MGLDILTSWIPDLILCDIMMPEIDGHEVHRLVSESVTLNKIPFIFYQLKMK